MKPLNLASSGAKSCQCSGATGSPDVQVFELGGDVVPPAMAANLTRLIAEGSGQGDAASDAGMRSEVVASYLDLLQRPKLSDVLLTVCTPPADIKLR